MLFVHRITLFADQEYRRQRDLRRASARKVHQEAQTESMTSSTRPIRQIAQSTLRQTNRADGDNPKIGANNNRGLAGILKSYWAQSTPSTLRFDSDIKQASGARSVRNGMQKPPTYNLVCMHDSLPRAELFAAHLVGEDVRPIVWCRAHFPHDDGFVVRAGCEYAAESWMSPCDLPHRTLMALQRLDER